MDNELKDKLDTLERKVEETRREASDKDHTVIIWMLIVLLFRSCSS
jgi:hypothetical protein